MAGYSALLRKSKRSDYSVDRPGCITAGKTLEEARQLATEALAFHIQSMEEHGETIPAPSTPDTLRLQAEHRDVVPVLLEVEPSSKTGRVNITMPARMPREIDRYADRIGVTRPAFPTLAANVVQHGQLRVDAKPATRRKAGFSPPRRRAARANA